MSNGLKMILGLDQALKVGSMCKLPTEEGRGQNGKTIIFCW